MPLKSFTENPYLRGIIAPAVIGTGKSPPLFTDGFETGDFSKWNVTLPSPFAPYGTIVTSPVYRGTYAAKLWTNTVNVTPILAKVFPIFYNTLFFRSFIQFIRMPLGSLYHVAELGEYRGDPWWGFVWVDVDLSIGLYSAKYYWYVDGARTTQEVSAGTWYKVQLMASKIMRTTKVWIDDVLIRERVKTVRMMSSAGCEVYPTAGPVNDGFYIDDVEISALGPIG